MSGVLPGDGLGNHPLPGHCVYSTLETASRMCLAPSASRLWLATPGTWVFGDAVERDKVDSVILRIGGSNRFLLSFMLLVR